MLEILEPSEISPHKARQLEDFRFPITEYPYGSLRDQELKIYHLYTSRSIEIIYWESSKILSCLRIISKFHKNEKLPIEYAIVLSGSDVGKLFTLPSEVLPVCEISSLRVANLLLSERFQALTRIINACDSEVHQRGFRQFYVSCGTQSPLKKLYTEKCYFKDISRICYKTDSNEWYVLCRESQIDFNKKELSWQLSSLQKIML